MKPLAEQLGSLSLTTATLIILLLWLSAGILLNATPTFFAGFESMNRTLLSEWLRFPQEDIFLKSWFLGLCLCMALLGVNLIFCSWRRIFNLLRKNFSAARALMLFVHFLFGFVALGHFSGFMFGYRYEDIRLAEGHGFQLAPGHGIKVEKIQLANAPRTLGRSDRTPSVYDLNPRQNFAEVSMSEEGREIRRQKISFLTPLRFGTLQVTLRGFTAGPDPKVVLAISNNPTLRFFLTLYPLMIVGMGLHLAITWKKTPHAITNVTP
jgi:hypothetical protein